MIIAAIGLLATTTTAIGVPYIQGRIASQRDLATKLLDERITAYAEAMVYLRAVQGSLDETVTDPMYRQSAYKWPDMPHRDLITARLHLVAPVELMTRWDELTVAWDALCWNLQEDGPANDHGEFYAAEDSADITRVRHAIETLTAELRQGAGAKQAQ